MGPCHQVCARLEEPWSPLQTSRTAADISDDDHDADSDESSRMGPGGSGRLCGTAIEFFTKGCHVCGSEPFRITSPGGREATDPMGSAGSHAVSQPPRWLQPHEVPVSGVVTQRQLKGMLSYRLDLARLQPDRMIARLLVEHEMAARKFHR